MREFDGPAELARAAELRNRPFSRRPRAPLAGEPSITVRTPNGVAGKARLGDDVAELRIRRLRVTVPARWE